MVNWRALRDTFLSYKTIKVVQIHNWKLGYAKGSPSTSRASDALQVSITSTISVFSLHIACRLSSHRVRSFALYFLSSSTNRLNLQVVALPDSAGCYRIRHRICYYRQERISGAGRPCRHRNNEGERVCFSVCCTYTALLPFCAYAVCVLMHYFVALFNVF